MAKTSPEAPETELDPVARVLQLFEARKQQLRFPDVDADKLKALQATVQKEHETVFAMEEKLAEAREALALAEQELREKAEKAFAYLQIFASGDAKLEAQVAEIKWNAGDRSGRKRKPMAKKKATGKPEVAEAAVSKGEAEEGVVEVAAE